MASSNDHPRSVLIGTVGYHFLRDFSIGPKLLPRLREQAWPDGVELDEMNWGPIAIVQNFEDLKRPYDRVVILTAREAQRAAGTVTIRRWQGGLPDTMALHARVCEAVTGVISADNLLLIGEHFGIWPDETLLVDVEPGPEEAGEDFTPAVEAAVPAVLDAVRCAALWPLDRLVTEPLNGLALEAA